jgi:drug/metabolite transporter (DMT)-like permease
MPQPQQAPMPPTEKASGAPRKPVSQAAIFGAAMIAVVFFSLTAPLTRAITFHLDPMMLGMRPTAAGLVAIPLIAILRLKGPRNPHEWLLLVISALGSFVAFPVLYTLGQAATSASHGALIQASMPIITGAAAAIVERRRPGRAWFVGGAVAFAGEAILVLFRNDNAAAREASIGGDLIILLACILSAGSYVAGSRLAQRSSALSATLYSVALAALVLLPFAVPRAFHADWSNLTPGLWVAVGVMCFGPTLLAFIAWFWALSRGGVQRVAVFQFAQSPLAVLIAIVFLGEPVTVPLLIALAAILGGIAIARRARP